MTERPIALPPEGQRDASPLDRDGGPAVETPTRKGFGWRVIEQMIAQLKGKTCFDCRADGLVCEITLPPLMPTGATQPTSKGA